MFFHLFYNQQLAQASYLVGCQATGEALVLDPTRDLEQYLDLAAREGLRVTAVTETHIHADFVSGARELAARTGARLFLSGAGPAAWQYAYASDAGVTLLHEGDSVRVGALRLDVLHTPGHTPEHLSFVLTDTAQTAAPMGIFTGDFVFVGDVGRPDLLETAAGIAGTKEQAARQLYGSLHRFVALPDHLQVWPGHGAGSACGKALGAVPQSTVGYEKQTNWGLAAQSEGHFVESVLAGQPEPPPYFARMKRINKEGPTPVADDEQPARLNLAAVLSLVGGDAPIVDVRPAAAYAAGHVPGAISLPLGPAFLTWAGWLLPYDRPLALLGGEDQIADAVHQLRLIGLDAVAGAWTTQVLDDWRASGRALAVIRRTDTAGLHALLQQGAVHVLDVRSAAEHAAAHIAGSLNIPLGALSRQLAAIPDGRPVAVHCQGGLRSAIAAGILDAHGVDVIDLDGGFSAWEQAALPREDALPAAARLPVAV